MIRRWRSVVRVLLAVAIGLLTMNSKNMFIRATNWSQQGESLALIPSLQSADGYLPLESTALPAAGSESVSKNTAINSINIMNKTLDHDQWLRESLATDTSGVADFVHHSVGVVLVVKIHGPVFLGGLRQSLCLLHSAYNYRTLYDVIVFSTLPINETDINVLRAIVHPASLQVKVDDQTLQEQLADLQPVQQKKLRNRCLGNISTTSDLQWGTRCKDNGHIMPLAYCWMSEFRSKEIWSQKVLRPYRYMLWFDSDMFPMKEWKHDPVAHMIRNHLVLYMSNFGQGVTRAKSGVQRRIKEAYNKTLCSQQLDNTTRRLSATYGPDCWTNVQHVHGYFHLTDLDFYRLPINLNWFDVMIGKAKFSRTWDDQLAVIVPPSMLAPERAQEMPWEGIEVMHNGILQGKINFAGGGFLHYWRKKGGSEEFPRAEQQCINHLHFGTR
jgi:hypothetical protein